MFVYHGTWADDAEAILRDGFADTHFLDGWGQPGAGVFVALDASFARGFGPVVLEIELDAATAADAFDEATLREPAHEDEGLISAAALNRCPIRVLEVER
jgi:hypothetical protein